MSATARSTSVGIGVLGVILSRFSETERSSYYQAQRDYSESMEFDAESKVTGEEQATVMRLLNNWAAKKPIQIDAALAATRKKKAVHTVDVGLGYDLADPGSRLRMHKALLADRKACRWLVESGCSTETIVHFSLGLTRGLRTATDALAAPLLHRDGQFYKKYVNTVIPGVTDDHRDMHKRSSVWSAGDALVYYGAEQKSQTRLLVCDTVLELWAIWSAIRGTPIADDLQLIASTNPSETPRLWKKGDFWESWVSVYLGHTGSGSSKPDKGDDRAKGVARLSDRETLRVRPVGAKDWVGFFRAGKNAKHFEELLSSAWPLSEQELEEQSAIGREPWFSVKPVDITVGVHNSFLFEVIEIGEWVTDADMGEPVQRMRTTVVRSDRTTHSVRAMPAPAGTPANQVVHRLWPDGTVVPGQLKPRMSPSWRIESIQAFLRGEGR
ncbi:MAG: hypothetical protein RB191_09250, partial [Terriglobia bacterium]|nr:hypothetical protein [Terriglobia bacterium]